MEHPSTPAAPDTDRPEPKGGKGQGEDIAERVGKAVAKALEDRNKAMLHRFEALVARQAEQLEALRAELAVSNKQIAALYGIVRAALPSQLLRLTRAHLDLLREKAPQAKVKLIEPYKAQTVNLQAGTVLDVTDSRLRQYGNMQVALVLGVESDVDNVVRALIDAEVKERTAAAAAVERRRLEEAAAAAHAEAKDLHEQAAALLAPRN